MTWVKLDDGFPEHPKVLGLSDAAFRLHVAALCYVARNLTDGVIPRIWLTLAKGSKTAVAEAVRQLVFAELWTPQDNDFTVHDYLEYQRSRAQVEQLRERNADRVKRHRNAITPPLQDRTRNGHVTRLDTDTDTDQIREDPEKKKKRAAAAASGSSLDHTEMHRGHINGFCAFVCFSEQKAQEFAKTLSGGLAASQNFDTVIVWAEGVRNSWGTREIASTELKWYDFWEARWKERTPPVSKNRAVLQRAVERLS